MKSFFKKAWPYIFKALVVYVIFCLFSVVTMAIFPPESGFNFFVAALSAVVLVTTAGVVVYTYVGILYVIIWLMDRWS